MHVVFALILFYSSYPNGLSVIRVGSFTSSVACEKTLNDLEKRIDQDNIKGVCVGVTGL